MRESNSMTFSEFQERFGTETQCEQYMFEKRWPNGFICPKCGGHRFCKLSNGLYQCAACHHQTSLTAGTILQRTHLPLTKWFLALYLVSQDKRGISAVQLQQTLGVTYKTAWYMLFRIRDAMSQRDSQYKLNGVVEFDDAFFGGPTVGKKRGRGTEKHKVFVALSLDSKGNPRFLKMQVTENIKQASVRRFAESNIEKHTTIHSDGYRSYTAALSEYDHRPKKYDPNNGLLHWIHIAISNAKAFILGTYHGLPGKNLNAYLEEFCYRFNRRHSHATVFDSLSLAVAAS